MCIICAKRYVIIKFFRGYAELWRETSKLSWLQHLLTDAHPMSYIRVNAVLQQFDEFLDYYEITEGDGMYLSSENRVAIW